jgi:plasmid stabilization system protein ParE
LRHIRWAPAAADDPEQIRNYLQEHYKAARSLKRFPHRGRNGKVDGNRELVMHLCRTSSCTVSSSK